MDVKNLQKLFPLRRGFLSSLFSSEKPYVRAVDDVSFQIRGGEILGLVGESGCGKTTLGRLLCRYENPTQGSILFKGADVTLLKTENLKQFHKRVQMIFQDPYESLDPRFTVGRAVAEPLVVQDIGTTSDERLEMVAEMLEHFGLKPAEDFINRYPHELSGGQRQRIVVARAMILRPELIVADEPVSMLDVSIRSGILNLMLETRDEFKVTYAFITHDLAVARYMSDRIAIMYLGKIVELGPKEEVIQMPSHPYAELLSSAVPNPDPTAKRSRVRASGEIPSAFEFLKGCRFHPRCPYAKDRCTESDPEFEEVRKDHYVACHDPLERRDR